MNVLKFIPSTMRWPPAPVIRYVNFATMPQSKLLGFGVDTLFRAIFLSKKNGSEGEAP
jgi:hypothetical protein